jgi:hypothetical protein
VGFVFAPKRGQAQIYAIWHRGKPQVKLGLSDRLLVEVDEYATEISGDECDTEKIEKRWQLTELVLYATTSG